jgi:hypothetical protein
MWGLFIEMKSSHVMARDVLVSQQKLERIKYLIDFLCINFFRKSEVCSDVGCTSVRFHGNQISETRMLYV